VAKHADIVGGSYLDDTPWRGPNHQKNKQKKAAKSEFL
jgi:hypothetical protein